MNTFHECLRIFAANPRDPSTISHRYRQHERGTASGYIDRSGCDGEQNPAWPVVGYEHN